jgi:hypothetical protein
MLRYLVEFLIGWEEFQTKIAEEIKTRNYFGTKLLTFRSKTSQTTDKAIEYVPVWVPVWYPRQEVSQNTSGHKGPAEIVQVYLYSFFNLVGKLWSTPRPGRLIL